MFGIGGWEFILIAGLALILFGPDKLPELARTAGRFMRDFKRYQDLMTSTLRAEMYASDTEKEKDAFEKGKEFREKVASGAYSPRRDVAPPMEPPAPVQVGRAVQPPAPSVEEPLVAETVAPAAAPVPGQPASDAPQPAAVEGEGERE